MFRVLLVIALLLTIFVSIYGTQRSRQRRQAERAAQPSAANEHKLPQRFFWVWERPEDLRELHPASEGAAVLEGTLHLDHTTTFTPRHQPYLLPAATTRIAVVRIEAGPSFRAGAGSSGLVTESAHYLARVGSGPGIAALQIDFDARRSQRAFYRELLEAVRKALPATLPLEMTALVSWCGDDDWIGSLPVNNATPMFFRMEPDRNGARRREHTAAFLPEPLCQRSVGVSTHESWPEGIANKRTYIFADSGWKTDLPLLRSMEKRP